MNKNVGTLDAILVDHVDPWQDPELVAATSSFIIQLVAMLPHLEEMQKQQQL